MTVLSSAIIPSKNDMADCTANTKGYFLLSYNLSWLSKCHSLEHDVLKIGRGAGQLTIASVMG